jgi:endo-1,4-beta-xylanase
VGRYDGGDSVLDGQHLPTGADRRLQSHFVVGAIPSDLETIMRKFASLDVAVAVTELDLRLPVPPSSISLVAQAADYATVVSACRATRRCVAITTWGPADRHSWIPSTVPGYGAALLFDENYRPKPAVAAMTEAFTKELH